MTTILDFALLVKTVYRKPGSPSRDPAYDVWEEIGQRRHDVKTGYHAQVFRNKETNKIVISIRGTDFTNRKNFSKDVKANIQLFFHQITDRSKAAIQHALDVHQQFPNTEISVTGHSLGGNCAQAVAVYFKNNANLPDINAITFNSPGIAKNDIQHGVDYPVLNLFTRGDVIRYFGATYPGDRSSLGMGPSSPVELFTTSDLSSVADLATPIAKIVLKTVSPSMNYILRNASSFMGTFLNKGLEIAFPYAGGALATTAGMINSHLMGHIVTGLRAAPALGHLTPEEYRRLMKIPKQLQELANITQAEYIELSPHEIEKLVHLSTDELRELTKQISKEWSRRENPRSSEQIFESWKDENQNIELDIKAKAFAYNVHYKPTDVIASDYKFEDADVSDLNGKKVLRKIEKTGEVVVAQKKAQEYKRNTPLTVEVLSPRQVDKLVQNGIKIEEGTAISTSRRRGLGR